MNTNMLHVDVESIGQLSINPCADDLLDKLKVDLDQDTVSAAHIREAVSQLQHSDVPVAFPTETVYGLGADATRSAAVKGIFAAKQRPADNPLIVHFSSLRQLRELLQQPSTDRSLDRTAADPIPAIYHPLIRKFWPGPLTIILPVPDGRLAPEVTAGLDTFGARIPRHPIALALIDLAGVPIAAPSANASTKPSPTAAEHVATDLDGRIRTIIDGGPCAVGVESTVVDGLSSPPAILRPGGISIEQLRTCPGWESVSIAYHDAAEKGSKPKAPGMKYRHYSPKAPVLLYETGRAPPHWQALKQAGSKTGSIALLRTRYWTIDSTSQTEFLHTRPAQTQHTNGASFSPESPRGFAGMLEASQNHVRQLEPTTIRHNINGEELVMHDLALGSEAEDIARGIFAALRTLDKREVDAIFVEGIDDSGDDLAAAVMNRLRKAAETRIA